jgi:hypothetical protein
VLGDNGQVLEEGIVGTSRAALSELSGRYPKALIVMEAGCHSPWVSRYLKEAGCEVVVSNPRKTRAIYQHERKSNRRDALMLARIARMVCTPAVMNIRVMDRNPVSHNVSAKTIVAVYMIRSEVGAERNQHRSPDQPEMDPIFRLLYNGQREIISIAALVVNLQSVVASGDCRAIRKVTKDACNRGRGRIVN